MRRLALLVVLVYSGIAAYTVMALRVQEIELPAAAVQPASEWTAPAPEPMLGERGLSATLERPLFWPDRAPRPIVEEARAVEVPPIDRLLGVLRTEAGPLALVSVDGRVARVMQGEAVSGWVFVGVDDRVAVFDHPDRGEARLSLAESAPGNDREPITRERRRGDATTDR